MKFEIIFAPDAFDDLSHVCAYDRAKVKKVIEKCLRHEPTKVSKSRIKRLRGLSKPQYRLRVDNIRIFYDVNGSRVEVLAIISKSAVEAWLKMEGKRL